MKKCLKITFGVSGSKDSLRTFVQKYARDLGLEGTAQMQGEDSVVTIVVCGGKENVDEFIDILHEGTSSFVPDDIEIEPFSKNKDYRGVFRILE